MIQIEKIDGVRKFRLSRTYFGRALYYTAAYWVDGLMIDTGCAYTVRDLISALEDVHIDLIVNTHTHEDHIGANASLSRKFGAKIFAHYSGLPVLSEPRKRQPLRPYQLVMWGYPEPSKGAILGDSVETANHRFQVIHTPGHSTDHICLYEPDQGWLFSGDAYIGGHDRALRADYNIWQIIDSLHKLARLDVNLLFTGSGSIHKFAHRDLLEKIYYLEETAERVLQVYRQGWSYGKIKRAMFGHELLLFYVTLGQFSGKNLVRSIIEDLPANL
ncbi:MAG: MBL fold metallo-hydrolase [Deltaproteobacteria bacterium]|nr:MAG: MBL fold metallo-hydrolase [Deltaproteobacteria bacterium]